MLPSADCRVENQNNFAEIQFFHRKDGIKKRYHKINIIIKKDDCTTGTKKE